MERRTQHVCQDQSGTRPRAPSSNIGTFGMLPLEARALIWDQLRPQYPTIIKSSMNILQTCTQLYNEINPRIYSNEVLTFEISPLYTRECWFRVTSKLGAEWILVSVQHAHSLGFGNLPFHKLKGIVIIIWSPCNNDPGQAVCLSMKVRDVVDIFAKTSKFRNIDIFLRDSNRAPWAEFRSIIRTPNRLLQLDFGPQVGKHILETILPFIRITHVQCATIHVPEILQQSLLHLNYTFEMTMMSQVHRRGHRAVNTSFGVGDSHIRNDLDLCAFELDCALDFLPGETARMLRLRRFSSWYDDEDFGNSSYINALERIIRNLDESPSRSALIIDIKWRYRVMVAFNPLSARMQKLRARDRIIEHSMTIAQLFERFSPNALHTWPIFMGRQWQRYHQSLLDPGPYMELDRIDRAIIRMKEKMEREDEVSEDEEVLKDRWDSEEWYRYYPEGIPELNASLYSFEISMGRLWSDEWPRILIQAFPGWEIGVSGWEHAVLTRHFHTSTASQ